MLQTVCGNDSLSCSSVFEWFIRCKVDREDLQDDPKSGRPSASRNVDAIANMREVTIREHRWGVRMMTVELNSKKETIHQILHEDLVNKEIRVKFVPHTHSQMSRNNGDTSCQDFIQTC
jgi:hypothetical protein